MADARTPILYVAPWVDLGGSDRGTIDWFKHIDRDRWAPSLITTTPSPNRWLHHVEPYAEEVWDLPDLMPGSSFPEFILGFIESRGIRVVHIMNSRLAFDLLPDMTCLADPPAVVVQLHAEEPNQTGYVRYVARRYANLIDAFSVVSEDMKRTLVGYEIPPSKIDVIYLGVDGREEFNPGRVAPLELDGNGARRVLWPGRLVEQKDPMLTLEVLTRARERSAPFVLDIVGDGHLKDAVQAQAERAGVADLIRWHPPSQEMARWYRSADLVLMTSLYEGIPLVVYEALAMGVPVVAPALPGNVELMGGEGGVLVEPRDDPDSYAEAIARLLEDDERRRTLGERARERMLADFSLEEMGRRHDRLYERLLAEKPATGRWRNEELLGRSGDEHEAPVLPEPLRLPRDPPPERSVGVIVPCYRHGIFLDGCIASIKAQTLEPAAIVVVDDGSEDPETVEALARLDDDPEVTVLRQPANTGPSAARNRALAELETSYVLPVDADDELFPGALERTVAQLEEAPEDVGFVYGQARHMGNREDLFEPPAYNVWLLMEQNYCPATALFDRRVFEETGIRYPEEIVVGHEDWDVVLELAEHGVRGIPADALTFRYRKQGFSRVNAVDYGPDVFHQTIEERHRGLYRSSDRIKARWSPALSVVLLADASGAWRPEQLAPLERQTCRDFEVLQGESLQEAIDEARGRWILLLPRSAAGALEAKSFVERLIQAFEGNSETAAVVLADVGDPSRHLFSQLDDRERRAADPAAVAFRRPVWWKLPKVALGAGGSAFADLVIGLQPHGPVQWRVARISDQAEPRPAPGGPGADGARSLDLNLPAAESAAETSMRQMIASQSPLLPELRPDTVRRWEEDEPWTPPQTQLICRHEDPATGVRVVTVGRKSPPGHRFERVLGSVHILPAPGTRRLVHANHGFELVDEQDRLPDGHLPLGYVEDQPLPMLEALELRRLANGQATLVAGAEDPLLYESEHLEVLGWIEPYPILPRAVDVYRPGGWAVDTLRRRFEPAGGGRHRYWVDAPGPGEGTAIGALHRHPNEGLVALRRLPDGRLGSDIRLPVRASRHPRKIARWVLDPLLHGARPGGRVREAGGRVRRLAQRARAAGSRGEGVTLGYLRRDTAPGSSPLFSMIHPVSGDQLLTRFPSEGLQHGYAMGGILGVILDPARDEASP